MKLLHPWSVTVPLVTIAISLHTTAGVPLNEGQSRRPSRYAIRSVKSREIKSDQPLWDDVVVMRWIAEENLVGTKSAAHDANAVAPRLSTRISQGERKGEATKKQKRSNGVEDEVNNGQPAISPPDAINEAQIKQQTAEEAKQDERTKPRTQYRAVTPEELELVLTPEDIAEYERLRAGSNAWYRLIIKKRRFERKGFSLTSEEEEQLRIGTKINSRYRKMQRAIQRQLIERGVARPEMLERKEKLRSYLKANSAAHYRNLPPEKLEQTKIEANERSKAKWHADNERIRFLHVKKAEEGLGQEEQQELDAIEAKRARMREGARARYRRNRDRQGPKVTRERKNRKGDQAVNNNPPSEDVSEPNPSGSGEEGTPSSEHPPTSSLEMSSTGQQQPGTNTMDSSTAQTDSPNQWHAGLLPFIKNKLSGKSFLDNLSRVVTDRLHNSPTQPAPGIRPLAPPPRLIF